MAPVVWQRLTLDGHPVTMANPMKTSKATFTAPMDVRVA
jgi:hypothetical protein